jgi:hypothetical protein
MPILGTHDLMAAARIAAEDVVRAKWLAKGKVLSVAEIAQMRLEMKVADSTAIILHLVGNTTVAGTHIT